MSLEFTHLDSAGAARMVDVTAKTPTVRSASAEALVTCSPQVVAALVGLGWNEAAATGAVLQVTTTQNATDVSALLRAALRNLGAAKRV